jgi:thiamine-monophosphate kinase
MREFDFIARLRACAGDHETGLDLSDDAARYAPPAGCDLVLSTDAMQRGRHFRETDAPEIVARRVVAAAVSDLIAKGARPQGCLMSFARHPEWDDPWLEAFVVAFAAALKSFGLSLWGGDTIDGFGQIGLTVIGIVTAGKMVPRKGAQIGDDVYVTGTIGSAFLGLHGRADPVLDLYSDPAPPLGFAPALIDHASAALDISDGLAIDLDRICELSQVAMQIDVEAVPLCSAGEAYITDHSVANLIAGGDDYQVAFTAAPAHRAYFDAQAVQADIRLTRIGRVTAIKNNAQADFKMAAGGDLELTRRGFQHF